MSKSEGTEIKDWKRVARETFESLLELWQGRFMEDGSMYGIEQLTDNPEKWDQLQEARRQIILEEVSKLVGLDLLNPPVSAILKTYKDEGSRGEPSEHGGEVRIYRTNLADVTVEITYYDSPSIGTRYNIVFGK